MGSFSFSIQPIIYLLNISKKDFIRGGNKHLKTIKEFISTHGGGLTIPFRCSSPPSLS